MFQRKIISSKIKKFACGAVFLEMTKILSKMVLWNQKLLLIPGTKKKTWEKGKRKKERGEKWIRRKKCF